MMVMSLTRGGIPAEKGRPSVALFFHLHPPLLAMHLSSAKTHTCLHHPINVYTMYQQQLVHMYITWNSIEE